MGRLSVEWLEHRLNLSSAASMAVPAAVDAPAMREIATLKRYRIEPLSNVSLQSSSAADAITYGQSWTNPQYPEAQEFFNRFKDRHVNPTPSPTPEPTSPDPTPSPTPAAFPVTITQSTKGHYTRLAIEGTSGHDSIVIAQSGATLIITASGQSTTRTGNFTELVIHGRDGNDTITIDSSVSVASLLYGDAGSNTLTAAGSAKSYIISLGNAETDVLTGNGQTTSFWADPGDTINASVTETANGGIHRINTFYQPYTTNPADGDYVSTTLAGQDLRDPIDSGTTVRLDQMLWATGPAMVDVNQGQVGDCYFLAAIQSLAFNQSNRLREMAVDLGDGTYAVQFKRAGVSTYIRVDGDLPLAPWGGLYYTRSSSGGAIWAAIMEKAYAYYRTASNSFSSLTSGWTGAAFSDLGVLTITFNTTSSTLFSQITTALASSKSIAAITNSTVSPGIPIIGNHAYSILATSVEAGNYYVTVRNPWGFDGTGNDGNTTDGILKITLAQFQSAFSAGSVML